VDTLLALGGVRSAHQMGQRCCRDRAERREQASTVLGLVVTEFLIAHFDEDRG
jgi:hypothetical protein